MAKKHILLRIYTATALSSFPSIGESETIPSLQSCTLLVEVGLCTHVSHCFTIGKARLFPNNEVYELPTPVLLASCFGLAQTTKVCAEKPALLQDC